MKIGIVCYPTYGGSGVVATELGKGLAQKGHEVHFITYEQPTRLDFFSENIFFHKVDIKTYPLFEYPPYELALASKMVSVVQSEKLDLLHVHYAIPHASSAFMAKQILRTRNITIPVVTTLHGTDITLVGRDEIYEPVVSFSINQSDGVTSVSEHLKEETLADFHITTDIDVIPNFIDLQRFQKQKKEHFKRAICPHGEKLLIHTSNFRKVKRVDIVIELFAKLKEHIPAKLLLIGDGPERNHIEDACHTLGIYDDVRFLGKLEAVEEVLSVGDLFLMPSEKESFGLAALEAMASGVPVISSNTGGLSEVNLQGESGFLSNVANVSEMAQNAIKILEDDEVLLRFKKRAKEVAKKFDTKNIVPLYEAMYENALNGIML